MPMKLRSASNEPLLGSASSWLELLNQNTMDSSMESSSEDATPPPKKRPRRSTPKKKKGLPKKRRTTYDIRKQQKSDLLAEVSKLEKQLDLLKHRVLVEQGEGNTTIKRTEVANSILHECAQNQHVTIAGMQAMFITHMQQSLMALHPTQTVIRLGANRAERHSTLMAMKNQKLREAKRFISVWSQGLDTNSSFSQENQFEALDGGFSVVRFDNALIRGTTVKAVFDAIIHSIQNVEILISVVFGSITIREDTDFNSSDISQICLVSSTTHGAVVESNSVIFSEYVDDPDGNYAIIAADFVDEDELYPYRTDERVRRNTITVGLIKSAKTNDRQDVVVGTRWTCLRLAHTRLDIPKYGLKELKEVSMAWGDTFKNCIMERLAKSDE